MVSKSVISLYFHYLISTISQGTVLDNASVKVQARSTLSKGEGHNHTKVKTGNLLQKNVKPIMLGICKTTWEVGGDRQ